MYTLSAYMSQRYIFSLPLMKSLTQLELWNERPLPRRVPLTPTPLITTTISHTTTNLNCNLAPSSQHLNRDGQLFRFFLNTKKSSQQLFFFFLFIIEALSPYWLLIKCSDQRQSLSLASQWRLLNEQSILQRVRQMRAYRILVLECEYPYEHPLCCVRTVGHYKFCRHR